MHWKIAKCSLQQRRLEFEQFCAEHTKALEAREAAAVELEATLKQQQAQSQQAAEGMHALEDRESKIAAREAEFERFRAKRTKALDAREAEVADLEILMKTFNAQNKYLTELPRGND